MTGATIDLAERERAVRSIELETLEPFLVAGLRVLELGGGSGHQAALLAGKGVNVVSVDIAQRARQSVDHPVIVYDGVRLPFAAGLFDLIWSSNTLEHVQDLPGLLAETRRVLRPGGLHVHAVPSVAWRAWSMLLQPIGSPIRLFNRRSGRTVAIAHDGPRETERRSRPLSRLRTALVPGPHGEFPSAVHEVGAFRSAAWVRRLALLDAQVVAVGRGGVFCTGLWTLPSLPMSTRRRLAPWIGSASTVLVLRDRRPASATA